MRTFFKNSKLKNRCYRCYSPSNPLRRNVYSVTPDVLQNGYLVLQRRGYDISI
nr:MAG TPA: hypothetical protein [Caudoviricetes sp.]